MRIEQLKIAKCWHCSHDMPVFNKRQRFCSANCRACWWDKENRRIERMKKAGVKFDLFGMVGTSTAAE